MKHIKSFLLTLLATLLALPAAAKSTAVFATLEQMEAAGLTHELAEIPGGTILVDNELGSFGLAYTDDWRIDYTNPFRPTDFCQILVGDSELFYPGDCVGGGTNPTFSGYEDGIMSNGCVYMFVAKQTGWMTVFNIRFYPNKQYLVFENENGALPYTLGAAGETFKINYCVPVSTSGNNAGNIDFDNINADLYFNKTGTGNHIPKSPMDIVGFEPEEESGLGYITFKVTAGNTYYVSGLGTRMPCKGFVFSDDVDEPTVTFLATDDVPQVTFHIRSNMPKLAGEHFEANGIIYTVIDPDAKTCKTKDGKMVEDYQVIPGNEYVGDLVIPETVSDGLNDYTVIEIGESSFKGNQNLTSVSLPSTIKTISSSAFANCTNLTTVSTQESLSTIESSCFEGCNKLSTISLPASLETLDVFSFSGCDSLSEITYFATRPIGIDGTYVFSDVIFANTTLNMPNALLNDITSVSPWDRFAHIIASDGTISPSEPVNGQIFVYDGIAYTVIDAEAKTVKTKEGNEIAAGNQVSGDIVIPETVKTGIYEFTVVEIGEKGFYGCESLTSISLPSTVEYIRESAFQNCSGLISIDIPDNLIEIRNYAFAGCENLSSISLANSIRELGWNTFANCSSLTSIVLPASLENIGEATFKECSKLESVTFSEGLKSIGFWGFINCKSLKSLDFPNSLISIGELAFQNCSGLETVTFGNSLSQIDNHAFVDCVSLQSVELPESLAVIGGNVFSGCKSLKSASFLSSQTEISGGLFRECESLESVILPTALGTLEFEMFMGCSSLVSIDIPGSLTQIKERAFKGCSKLMSIDFPNTLRSLGEECFNGCSSLETLSLPLSLAFVENGCFSDCNGLKSVDFESLETEIGPDAFNNCTSLISVNLPSYLTSIERGTFTHCTSLTTIPFPNSLTKIGDSAFLGCESLVDLKFPDEFTSIEANAFNSCTGLKTVYLPESLTQMWPFQECPAIREVTYTANIPLELGGFEGDVYENAVLKTPNATLADIQATEPWRNFKHIVAKDGSIGSDLSAGDDFEYEGIWYTVIDAEAKTVKTKEGHYDNEADNGTWIASNMCEGDVTIPASVSDGTTNYSVVEIGNCTFWGCSNLTSMIIPETVTSIGWGAFEGCSNLTAISLPDNVISIGERAFYSCSGLTSIIIPKSVTTIGEYVFNNCSSLTTINIPEKVTSIENGLFYGCSSLKSLIIPDGVTSIGERAFFLCSNLTSVNIPDGVTSIENNTFYSCSSLSSINLPESVASIGYDAFYFCSELTSVNIPRVKAIGERAFYYCSSLTSINIPEGLTSIGENAFAFCTSIKAISLPASLTSIGSSAFARCEPDAEFTYLAETPISAPDICNEEMYTTSTLNVPNTTLDSVQATTPWNKFAHIVAKDGFVGGELVAGDDFEYEGIWYTVIDASAKTVKTKEGDWNDGDTYAGNSVSGDVIISSTVSDGTNDYTVVEIGRYSFFNNAEMTSVSLPETVKASETDAFDGCTSLTKAKFATLEALCNINFRSSSSNPLYYAHHLYIGENEVSEIVFPESMTAVKPFTFAGGSNLASITLPNGITSIGGSAFNDCSGLSSFIIPESVTSIEGAAFRNCSGLTSINIPESITVIDELVFEGCSGFTSIILPNSITSIEIQAFNKCINLSSISLPEGLISIGRNAFMSCSALSSITIPATVTSIGNYAFYMCDGLTSLNYNATTPIEASENIFTSNYDTIYKNTVLNTPNATLESVQATTPWNLFKHIVAKDGSVGGELAAGDDFEYEGIIYTIIDAEAKTCKTKEGARRNGDVTFAPEYCTPGNSLEGISEVIIPEIADGYTVVEIGYLGFLNNGVISLVIIPGTVTTIGDYAFYNCENLRTVSLPESIGTIKTGAFQSCGNLRDLQLPQSLKNIGESAFNGCISIEAINIPESVSSIGGLAFWDCTAVKTITLPATMPECEYEVFGTGERITDVTYNAATPMENFHGLFNYDTYEIASLNTPNATLEAVQATVPWNMFKHIVAKDGSNGGELSVGDDFEYEGIWYTVIDAEAKTVKTKEGHIENEQVVPGNNYTGDLVIPAIVSDGSSEYSVIEIGVYGFTDVTGITSIVLPEMITSIQDCAFKGCSNLTSITLPETLSLIDLYAFSECVSLSDVKLPNSLTHIGGGAFIGCINLTSIVIPESLKSLEKSVFDSCSNLRSVVIPAGIEEIGENAFWECNSNMELTYNAVVPITAPDICNEALYSSATLNTPNATLEAVQATVPWNKFLHITASDGTIEPDVKVESITLSQSSAQLKVGETVTLSATVLPEDATDKTVTWSSSNPDIATVDAEGNVTAIALGEAAISASCGDVSTTCSVSVVQTPVESVTLNQSSAELKVGESLTLSATALPEDATDKTVTWTSSNPEIATVDAEGNVTAISAGEATITATCGNVSATCSVTVTTNSLSNGEDFEYEGIWYTVIDAEAKTVKTKEGTQEDDGTLIDSGNTVTGSISIPERAYHESDAYTVVEIGNCSFAGNAELNSIKIPSTVTKIGLGAFEICRNLTSISLPESLSVIDQYAFWYCTNLTSIDLPDALTVIDWGVFRGCESLKEITLPANLTTIVWDAFNGCSSLHSIELPASLTTLESGAFSGCEYLTEITYLAADPIPADGDVFEDVTYQTATLLTPNATLEAVQATVPWSKFLRITASDGSTFIPGNGDNFSFDGIVYTVIDEDNHILKTADGSAEGAGGNDFAGDLVIPSHIEAFESTYDVTEIGANSFARSDYLTSVTIPASIETIGEGAFTDCERLTSIIWQGNHPLPSEVVEEIGNPNLLIYVDSIQFAPAGIDHNIVVLKTDDGIPSCENLVLLQGYPFRPAIDFISLNSSLTQDYTQATVIGECAGWESLVLPFDVKSIYNDKCGELTPFAALTDIENQCPFWLYEADDQGEWKEAASIRAGIPYIISMPNNPDYLDRFNIDGPVRLSSSDPSLITREIASPYAVNWASGQAFSSMWLPLDDSQAANAMGLNVGIDNLTDDNGDTLLPGSAFCKGVTPRPLEAYVTRQGVESAKRIIGTQTGVRTIESISGLEIKAYIGKIIITSDCDRKIDIFAIDGTHIGSIMVKAGSSETVRDLTKGLYLVAGQKILVK